VDNHQLRRTVQYDPRLRFDGDGDVIDYPALDWSNGAFPDNSEQVLHSSDKLLRPNCDGREVERERGIPPLRLGGNWTEVNGSGKSKLHQSPPKRAQARMTSKSRAIGAKAMELDADEGTRREMTATAPQGRKTQEKKWACFCGRQASREMRKGGEPDEERIGLPRTVVSRGVSGADEMSAVSPGVDAGDRSAAAARARAAATRGTATRRLAASRDGVGVEGSAIASTLGAVQHHTARKIRW
jgi:hypothetical protein